CILRGTLDNYADRLPDAADAFCVIEVADSSYERDVGEKLQGYARAGVEQYVVINLRNRTAEVYGEADRAAGTYRATQVVRENESVDLRVGQQDSFALALAELLPRL